MAEITIPIGPQHPALKEPINITLKVEGEVIVEPILRIGYNHRGIEKAMEARSYIQNIYLAERVCGICSHVHSSTLVQGAEELLELEIPRRGLYIRTIFLELERIHSHLLWLGVAAHEVGFDTLFMYTWRDREIVMDLLELISGNRVNYAMNTVGGTRRDINDEQKKKLLKGMDALEERTKYYVKIATTEPTFLKRVEGVGILKKEVAKKLCAVGPTARGSGLRMDIRKDDPYAAYDEIPFEAITSDLCDVMGRTVVRVKELLEAYKIIKYAVNNLPAGEIRKKARRKISENEILSYTEAPRGELLYYIKSNGTEKPERVKIRTPTLANKE
jgi:NADH-quinone oxidoreductase subunit D